MANISEEGLKELNALKKKLEDNSKEHAPKSKYVLCPACDKPIHIEEFGGIFNIDGKEKLIHSNILCLQWLIEKQRDVKGET